MQPGNGLKLSVSNAEEYRLGFEMPTSRGLEEHWLPFEKRFDFFGSPFDAAVEPGARTPDPPGVQNSRMHLAVDDLWLSNIPTPTCSTEEPIPAKDLCDKLVQLQALRQCEQTLDLRKCAATAPPGLVHEAHPPRKVHSMWASSFRAGIEDFHGPDSLGEPWATDLGVPPPPPPPPGLEGMREVSRREADMSHVSFGLRPCDLAALASLGADPNAAAQSTSLGSLGHPFRCAPACKYVKRKGGCKAGAQCTNCHQCFWHRDSAPKDPSASLLAEQLPSLVEVALASVGSKGHPTSCGQACKYFRRKGSCRDGADCLNCHECYWQRVSVQKSQEETSSATTSMPPADGPPLPAKILFCIPDDAAATPSMDSFEKAAEGGLAGGLSEKQPVRWSISVGSVGHPHSCKLPCKYSTKKNGCKDGQMCPRCHLCRWTRQFENATEQDDSDAEQEMRIFL